MRSTARLAYGASSTASIAEAGTDPPVIERER
jgi:hypothetical protein